MVNGLETLLIDWLASVVDYFPVLLFLAVVAYDLRAQLIRCIDKNNDMLDKLWEDRMNRRLED